jgi:hypothetical protein
MKWKSWDLSFRKHDHTWQLSKSVYSQVPAWKRIMKNGRLCLMLNLFLTQFKRKVTTLANSQSKDIKTCESCCYLLLACNIPCETQSLNHTGWHGEGIQNFLLEQQNGSYWYGVWWQARGCSVRSLVFRMEIRCKIWYPPLRGGPRTKACRGAAPWWGSAVQKTSLSNLSLC